MELKLGYKKTEVGIVPEDWASGRLEDFFSFISYGFTNPMPTVRSGVYMITAADINEGNIQYDSARFTSEIAYNALLTPKSKPIKNDILLTKDGSLGRVAIVGNDRICINQSVAVIRPNDKVVPNFLKLLLESPTYQKKMLDDAGGSTIKHIYITVVNLMPIAVPILLSEQRAIAAALCDVDALIASLDRVIAKKRDLKQAAMQELLTGKRRLSGFSGKWEAKKLGEIGTFSKGKGIRKDEVVADGIPCIRYGEIYTQHNDYVKSFSSFISPRTVKQSQILCKGDLLFAGSGETAEEIGKCVAFLGDEEAYAGGDIVIFAPTGQDSKYLGYLMNDSTIIKQKSRMGQGDAVVHISARNLAQLELNLPPLPEQTAIATILSDMDADIATMEQKLDKTRMLKQGMMQELLTGKIRLT